MKMKEKEKIFLIAGLLFFANLALLIFFIFPSIRAIQDNSRHYLLLKKQIVKAKAEIANFKNFETHHQVYLKTLQEMDALIQNQLLIDKDLPLEFVAFGKDEAQRYNLSLEIIPRYLSKEDKEEKKQKKIFDSFYFQMILKGDFPSLLKFIKKLENSQWLVEIEKLTITKEKEEIRADLLIKTYVQNKSEK